LKVKGNFGELSHYHAKLLKDWNCRKEQLPMSLHNALDFDSLWDYDHPNQTEKKFHKSLLQLSEDDPAYLELLTQIARAQGLQRKFDEAHTTLDEVELKMGKTTSRPKIRYLLERGRAFNSSGQPEQARPLFEEAFELAEQIAEDSYAVDALHMLAIVASPAQSLTLNLRAIQLAESSKQERARNWLGSLYNNTGWSYHDSGDYASALEIFEKAEGWQRSMGRVNETRIATWCVARTLRSLERTEEALSKQMALKDEFEPAGESDGYVFEEIGECLLALDRAEEARPYFSKAYGMLSEDAWLAEQEPERLARLKELGEGNSSA
jgi:tetratricopeptide (TPR) repeat protein